MIRRSLALGVLLAFAAAAWAAEGPQELVRETSEQVLGRLRTEQDELKKDPGRMYDLLEKLVVPHFDFERMSRLVLGKYWRRATPEQKRRFVGEFRTLLVRSYGTALQQYAGQEVKYLPLRAPADATDVTVDTEVHQSSGPSVPVQYSLRKEPDGTWKVYDVVVGGISLVINYRSTFSEQVGQDGLDGLIERLARKNAEKGG